MHTIYVATAPEYGKQNFDAVLDAEIEKVKQVYSKPVYIGIADGAKSNWTYLSRHVSFSILDYYHVSEYLSEVSSLFGGECWRLKAYHRLKWEANGARKLLKELKRHQRTYVDTTVPTSLRRAISYFTNNLSHMNYSNAIGLGYPIGSGVIESACKTLVKKRLSQSGMRWHLTSIDQMLLIRGLVLTQGRWKQAWEFYDKLATKTTSY